ncbi:Suppressor of hairless protein J kappa-recombination signal-binding protein RBP-J kappa [Collichthys lucidus]|uniref:Suppressor of hairless protein J kappa-recombination signal-binding protein RBP-J kappa n=1 Tax=Collichthys lucidus TaxID=240159 RepID=A0A4U5UBN3_COLLU|nr:Suppressor of hairless protein J kappa-recombination signal-binding protein RBP-J kappa [Collichthys lucidus]
MEGLRLRRDIPVRPHRKALGCKHLDEADTSSSSRAVMILSGKRLRSRSIQKGPMEASSCGPSPQIPHTVIPHVFRSVAAARGRRLDLGFQGCQLLGSTREPGREAHADQSVTILHAKVAQKSYGNEKRFFCPPPCVYISGQGWRVMQDHLKEAGYGDSVYRVCGYMCLDNSSQSQSDTYKLVFDYQPNSRMFACAKSLFISDQDKRKHFCLLLRLFLGNRQEVGSFQSRMIKVISKPSQKRQSMKNADPQSKLQRAELSCRLIAGTMLVDFTRTRCLQEVIRKVNKQHAILDVDEPVSQLHKCAFQFRDNPQAYLCLSNDTIIQYQGPSNARDPSRVVLNDGSCWTIIGVEVVEYTFNQGLACIQTPVTPFPVITGLEVNGGGHVAMLEVHGENFNPHLKVWFGNSETETMFKSPKSLLCVVPDISAFSDGWRCLRRIITVPLSLIRLDGLIYRTSFSFTYTPELQPPPSVRGAAGGGGKREGAPEGGPEDDVLLETIHQEFTRANFHLFMQKLDELHLEKTVALSAIDRLCAGCEFLRFIVCTTETLNVFEETPLSQAAGQRERGVGTAEDSRAGVKGHVYSSSIIQGPRPSPCRTHILHSAAEGPHASLGRLCVLQWDKGVHCPTLLRFTAILFLYIITSASL